HVHPDVAIAFGQRRAHQSALERRSPVVLYAGTERLAEHFGNLVFEAFALLVRQRHVARIGANPERLQRCRRIGAGVRGRECSDEQAQGKDRFHAAGPPGELPLLTADEERNSNRESRAEARQERENSNPRVSFKETPGAIAPGVFVAFTYYSVSSIGASG